MATPFADSETKQSARICNLLRAIALLPFLMAVGAHAQDKLDAAIASSSSGKITRDTNAVLWEYPGDVSLRDLYYGEGGNRDAPNGTTFTFVKEDLSGTNPKLVVTDENGVQWKIKLGAEAKPEVAASRLVWAVGYFANEDYFLPEVRITGLPAKLHRGRQFIKASGIVRDARLRRVNKSESKKAGDWHWKHAPFTGTRELNGLRVLMALLNNWDLKDINNKILTEKRESTAGGPYRETYIVSDLGASFGTTGFVLGLRRSRGNLRAFESSKFMTKTTPQYVDFATPSRATLFELFDPPQFFMRLHLRWIGKRIPRADAKWMASMLERLSPAQIRDAFRAAGYSPEEVEGFARVIEKRISLLNDI